MSFVDQVRAFTDGVGVDVVYDSVGKDTIDGSLASLRTRGLLVSFGQSSGAVPPMDLRKLSLGGSLFLTRPSLMHYNAKRDDLVACAAALFDVVERGAVKIEVRQTYPLAEAERAHRDLEGRKTTGSSVLAV